jgi:MGT family glycosyltransferase
VSDVPTCLSWLSAPADELPARRDPVRHHQPRFYVAKIVAYTIQTPGHAYPFVPVLQELQRRRHAVWFAMFQQTSGPPLGGIRTRRLTWPSARADELLGGPSATGRIDHYGEPLAETLERVIREEHPDLLLVDPMLWGGMVVAEASGLPWASLAVNPKTIRGMTLDARGAGWRPPRSAAERLFQRVRALSMRARADRSLPVMNAARSARGLPPLRHLWECYNRAPLTIAATAMPFEYPRDDWSPSVRFVGPLAWDPAPRHAPDLARRSEQPLVLIAGSSIQESGAAREWITTAITALGEQPYEVIVTIPTDYYPKSLPRNVRAVQYLPHSRVLPHAACVVCHGGAGITLKALAAGVPVVAVPFGYDRFEVGRRVTEADAGIMLPGNQVTAEKLRRAVSTAIGKRPGASRLATAFSAAGGARRAADHLEELLFGAASTSPSRSGGPASARNVRA